MIEREIDYWKTVETNRLVFSGQKSEKVFSYIFIFIIVTLGLSVSFMFSKSLINKNSTQLDYLMAVVLPAIILLVVISLSKGFLTRDRLMLVENSINIERAKILLSEAAKNLEWKGDVISDNYMVFLTNFGFVNDIQTITLLIFPDNKIYFNSIDFPRNYIKPSSFMDNYLSLTKEYQKLEKEEKLLVTNAIANAGMRVR